MAVLPHFSKIILVATLFWLAGCENDPAEIDAMIKETKEVEEARDIKANFSQSGRMKAILEAPLMYRVKADTVYTEFPNSVLVTFYTDSGAVDNVVKANYARYFDLLHKVYMNDSVVVFNLKGDTLYARDLWWDQNLDLFYSEHPVKVRTLTQKLDGDGIQAKADFSKYTIINPRGPVAIPDEINPGPPQ